MSDSRQPNAAEAVLDRTDELTSLLVDEAISDEEFNELADLLNREASARERYAQFIQLHCDLVEHYRAKQAEPAPTAASPILSTLGGGAPIQPPTASDAGS